MNQPSHIMVIDDDITMLNDIEKTLTNCGYIVSLAESGTQAINILNSGNTPDMILLDTTMPDMDGYETLKKIKAINNIPIIFLSGKEDTESELNALCLGAIDYITKPFVMDILLARIKNLLELSKIVHTEPSPLSTPAIKFDEEKLRNMKAILTESEFKVGKMIALGYTNKEIAEKFSYSYGYVKKIAYRIFTKLGLSKRNEVRTFFVEQT